VVFVVYLVLVDEVVLLQQFQSDVLECVSFADLVDLKHVERPVVNVLHSDDHTRNSTPPRHNAGFKYLLSKLKALGLALGLVQLRLGLRFSRLGLVIRRVGLWVKVRVMGTFR